MQLHIYAVGRIRRGPEQALVDDYVSRFDRTGRCGGLGPLTVSEVEDRKGGRMAGEAWLLRNVIPEGAVVCVLVQRAKSATSDDIAESLALWRDDGRRHAAFVIGGADGLEPGLRDAADTMLSLGKMVWPHMLARVMLAEQLYRAATILAGTPYHRA